MSSLEKLLRTTLAVLFLLLLWSGVIIALPGYFYISWVIEDCYIDDAIKEIFTQPIKAMRNLWKR